jgi:hypothetical protein
VDEEEWLRSTDPRALLDFVGARGGGRKFILFGVACARRVWGLLPDSRWREAVDVAQRFAEDNATTQEFQAAVRAAYLDSGAAGAPLPPPPTDWPGVAMVVARSCAALAGREHARRGGDLLTATAREHASQARIVRDLFGPLPFHPVSFHPSWLTRDVHTLARTIDSERAFADLPLLADALEDAGCGLAEMLAHLRGGGPHFPGCWALDLVLGRD